MEEIVALATERLAEPAIAGNGQLFSKWQAVRRMAIMAQGTRAPTLTDLSIHIAINFFDASATTRTAKSRKVMRMFRAVQTTGLMPVRKPAVRLRPVDHAAFRAQSVVWLKHQSVGSVTGASYRKFVNEELLPELRDALPTPIDGISVSTARAWLNDLGWVVRTHKQDVYVDGHDRPDVVEHNTQYVTTVRELLRRSRHYAGDDLMEEVAPVLKPGELEVVLFFHDESAYSSHESTTRIRLPVDQQLIRKKGRGRALMASAFLCQCHGVLGATDVDVDAPNAKTAVLALLKVGVNFDGYWCGEDMLQQLTTAALPEAQRLHPNCELVFIFDNSSNHGFFHPTSLLISRLTLNPKRRDADTAGDIVFVAPDAAAAVGASDSSDDEVTIPPHCPAATRQSPLDADNAEVAQFDEDTLVISLAPTLAQSVAQKAAPRKSRCAEATDDDWTPAAASCKPSRRGAVLAPAPTAAPSATFAAAPKHKRKRKRGGETAPAMAAAVAPQGGSVLAAAMEPEVLMRAGWFVNETGQRVIQPMYFPDDHEDPTLRGQLRGVRDLLIERKLWPVNGKLPDGSKFLLKCALCKGRQDADARPHQRPLPLQRELVQGPLRSPAALRPPCDTPGYPSRRRHPPAASGRVVVGRRPRTTDRPAPRRSPPAPSVGRNAGRR